jgi:hypothetical protein
VQSKVRSSKNQTQSSTALATTSIEMSTAYSINPSDPDIFYIDSGCNKVFILQPVHKNLLRNLQTTIHASVLDFSGNAHGPSHRGTFLNTKIKAVIMPNANVNLLSYNVLVDPAYGNLLQVEGTHTRMVFADTARRHFLVAHNSGDGLYSVTKQQLLHFFASIYPKISQRKSNMQPQLKRDHL